MSNEGKQEITLDSSRVLFLSRDISSHLIKLAAAYHPMEMCGLLTGRKYENSYKLNNFHWIPNMSQQPGQWDYLMDPQAYFDVVLPIWKHEFVHLVGIFHTHPNGMPVPSKIDIDRAVESGENVPYLIYSPHGGFRAWMLKEDQREIKVVIK